MELIIPCAVMDCKYLNRDDAKHPKCGSVPEIDKFCRCFTYETDMGVLKESWRHVPGVESVKSHRSEYYEKAKNGELKDE